MIQLSCYEKHYLILLLQPAYIFIDQFCIYFHCSYVYVHDNAIHVANYL